MRMGTRWAARIAQFCRSIMKVFLLAVLGSLLCHTEAAAGIADIPETNQVILAEGDWTPSAEETHKVLAAIQSFLEGSGYTNDLSKAHSKNIMEHDKGYLDWMENRIRKITELAQALAQEHMRPLQ